MDNKRILERMARATDLSTEPIPGKPLVEIVSDSSVLIENHCGVMSYSGECISVKTKQGCIVITGSQMILSKMSKEQLRISGKIRTVELRGRK